MFNSEILADSRTDCGARLTTFSWTFPRCILAEVNTHRVLLGLPADEIYAWSRNASSSRAIPTEKLIQRVIDNPFIPDFRANKKGMQAGDPLEEAEVEKATKEWLEQRDAAVAKAKIMHAMNIHKQYINRLLEPWMWCTIIISGTDWENAWWLRNSEAAEPSFKTIAMMAEDQYRANEPRLLKEGEWHLPLIRDEDYVECAEHHDLITEGTWDTNSQEYKDAKLAYDTDLVKISTGRCARVSYLTHDGRRDLSEDVRLHDTLSTNGHWSPFEHIAQVKSNYPYDLRYNHAKERHEQYGGNFKAPFLQYRKTFSTENIQNALAARASS